MFSFIIDYMDNAQLALKAGLRLINIALNCYAVVFYPFNLNVIYVIMHSTNPFGKVKR
jgi:hypothetical protein